MYFDSNDLTESDCSDYDDDNMDSFNCTNMDPSLAKLMGVIIKEETDNNVIDWKPPSFSGLTNSNNLVSANKIEFEDVTYKIKNCIKLNKEELDFITQLPSDKKQIIIEIYNNLMK